jgi:hypothetical protein
MKSLMFAASVLAASPAFAQQAMDPRMPMDPAPAAAPAPAAQPAAAPDAMAGMDMSGMDMGGHAMTGALGPYPITREASGTSWQPDVSPHAGVMTTKGDWMLMGHALLNGTWDWQEGPRGDRKAFVSGMVMGMAQRQFASGDSLQLRAMLSPEPLMGARGYPLLLASGETADGKTPLIDRQHPHDLFMELSGAYSHRLSAKDSVFVYAGMPGEPAFGPPAFMHRLSIMDSPEAPISHHWLDSTHVTFGVVTAGVVHGSWKIEASRFTGREPDQHRWNFDRPRFDSTAARLSWNPTRELSLQASWAHVKSPEQLEPGVDQTRWSASAIYTRAVGHDGYWSSTLAWGRRISDHVPLDAYVAESAIHPNADWTVFGRYERVQTDELLQGPGGGHGPVFTVAKASIGAIRDVKIARHASVGLGALYAFNFLPAGLQPSYGGDPHGAMGFVRLKLD